MRRNDYAIDFIIRWAVPGHRLENSSVFRMASGVSLRETISYSSCQKKPLSQSSTATTLSCQCRLHSLPTYRPVFCQGLVPERTHKLSILDVAARCPTAPKIRTASSLRQRLPISLRAEQPDHLQLSHRERPSPISFRRQVIAAPTH